MNDNVVLVKDAEAASEPLVSITDLDGLIAMVQSAALQIHPWVSTVED